MIKKILLILLAILAAGAVMTFAGLTLVDWWWPILGALVVGFIIGIFIDRNPVKYFLSSLYVSLILAGAFYSLNYAFPRSESAHTEQVTVSRKYTQTRHHTERVGRHTRQGRPYTVYFIEVTFADGRQKELEIPASRYKRLRAGHTTDLKLAEGFFGIPVISLREI